MGWLPNNKKDKYLPETEAINHPSEPRIPREDRENHLHAVKSRLHRSLVERLDIPQLETMDDNLVAAEIRRAVSQLLNDDPFPLNTEERVRLAQELEFEILGLGPLEPLVREDTISDILVNRFDEVYIERFGKLELTDVRFRNNAHLMKIINKIVSNIGRRIDESSPMVDARLPDGSRVNAIIPPLALDGPMVSIRRFGTTPIDIRRLIELDAVTQDMADFMKACVQCKMNILISGGTGTGKTTFLNALSRWIPEGERVVTIEDAAELQLQREHVVRLETRPPNIEGKGCITQRDLVRNSLRMRPDRIVIGEVRGAETLDMLQAMNTGHEGSMTTVHANSPRDALRRLENMVSMAGINYPIRAIREQLSSALDVMVHLERMTGGKRRVVKIVEITGMEGDTVCLHDIFRFNQTGVDETGHACGHFEACGVRPLLLNRLKAKGVELPPDMFQHKVLSTISRESNSQ